MGFHQGAIPISLKEMTLFQGCGADDVDWAGAGVTASQFAGRLGHAQSLNVVVAAICCTRQL